MVDNALRCIESDYPALVSLTKAMGVLNAEGTAANGIAWDYIGYKYVEESPEEGQPETRTAQPKTLNFQ